MTVLSDRVDVLEATNANLVSILQGLQTTLQAAVDAGQGPDGWSPVLTVQSDGARRVLQITDWTGGGGTKPATGEYIGSSGLVATAGAAIDIRGAAGANGSDGAGWTGASYDSGTGVVTFTSDDGLGFSTGDIRGEKGDPGALFNWTGPWVDATVYVEGDGAESDGSSYVATADHTADSTTEPGVGASWETVWDLTAAAGDKGDTGDGFTGGSYDAGTGVVTFTSDDGLGFSTGDLRGEDGTGSGTVTSVDVTGGTGVTSSGGPVTSSGAITVALDSATQTSLGKADTAQQPPTEGAFVDGDKTKLDGIEEFADVTDTANVTAAGALMDSEVTNLAQVKAFNTADYATDAQGTLADNAMPKAGGAFTGDVTILALLETEDASSATSYALDPTTNGTRTTLTLTATTTLSDSMSDGESMTLRVLNGDTETLNFVSGTLWVGGDAPTLTGDDLIRFEKWGTDLIGYVGLRVA